MKRSRFTEEQIISILREQEAGVPVADSPTELPALIRQSLALREQWKRDGIPCGAKHGHTAVGANSTADAFSTHEKTVVPEMVVCPGLSLYKKDVTK